MTDAGPLIVPLRVEALVVNDHVRGGESFLRSQMGYAQLAQGGNAQPGLDNADTHFGGEEAVHGVPASHYYNGVYLKWRLPRALTWGNQDPAKEELVFPAIPNRWIVVCHAAAGGAPSAWLIESDYVWAPNAPKFETVADESAYFLVEADGGAPRPSFIGRRFDLATETWSEPGSSLGLTATGAGNPAFAVYQPQNNNVLSFVHVLGEAAAETFGYQVFGWYAKASEDPLGEVAAGDFAAAVAALGWELPEGTEAALSASRTVLAGGLNAVSWQPAAKPEGGAPSGHALSIAIGNSAVEALTGLVTAQAAEHPDKPVEPELLEAFQLDALALLDQPDGEARLAERLHDSLFQRYAGGHAWEIVDVPGHQPPAAAELTTESEWLLKLNEAQATLDAQIGELAGLRLHLYELWWKYFCWRGRYSANGVDGRDGQPPLQQKELEEELEPGTAGSVAQQVEAKRKEVTSSIARVPAGATKEELDAAIAKYASQQSLPESRQLKRAESRTYYAPNDPVVLLAGAGASGIVPAPESAQCRFPRQLVSGFEYEKREVTAATVPVPQPNLHSVAGPSWLAGVAEALAAEAYFTFSGNAAAIAKALGSSDRAGIEAAIEKAPIGTPPGSSVATWERNPWHPLLLIWAVEYLPIPLGSGPQNWSFEAGRYVWNGEGALAAPRKLGGTIQLGTGASFNMAARLKKFLEADPHIGKAEREELEKLLAFVSEPGRSSDWDLLSQALDGFNEGLLLGNAGLFANPSASEPALPSLSELVGAAPGYPPGPAGYAPPEGSQPPSEFQPLRGGQFCFTEVALVDEWGQALIPITPKGTKDEVVFMPAAMRPGVSSASARFTVSEESGGGEPERAPAPGTAGGGAGIAIAKLVPDSAPAGSPELTLEVEGSGFEAAANPTVSWNGLPLATRFVSATKLSATVPAQCLALPDTVAVAVGMDRRARAGLESLVQIPPAIPQPARLGFDLLSAGDDEVVVGPLAPEADPICGWLVPNHLDSSLAAYLPNGEALGELASGIASTAKPELLWRAAPGAPYAKLEEVEAGVPHLGPMLGALQRQGQAGFAAFLAAVDETLWSTAPAGAAFGSGLATLIGRPLAMVRARVGFDLLSGPRRDPSWRYTFDPQPAALGACDLAVELGGRAWLDDGLVGYFEAEEYGRLFVVAQAGAAESGYLHTIGEGGNHLSLAADGSASTCLSLLLDPRAPVHASTPVLPGASLALPPRLVEAALGELEVGFRLEGVLTASETTAGEVGAAETRIRLPLPAVEAGRWSWHELDAAGWAEYPTATTDATAALGDVPPVLRRGLLQLSEFAQSKPSRKERK